MKKKNVPGGKKIICSVLSEEKDSLLKPCRRNIREVTVTAVSFLPVILPQLGNIDVHTVAKKPKDKITIDHIFPVHCMEKYPAVRKRAALLGIHGSNDMKNLCTACMRCNQKKRDQNGNLDFERISRKTAMVLAASENTYGDIGGFCVIPGAKKYICQCYNEPVRM